MNYKTTIVQKEMKSSILYIDAANSINDIRIAEKSIWVENIPKYGYNMFYLLFTNKKNKIEKNVLNNIISSRKYNSYLLSYIVLTYNLIKTLKTSKPSFVIVRNRADIGVIVLCLGKFFKFKSVYIKAFPQLELMISKTSNKLRILVLKLVLQWEIFLMKRSDILIVRSKKYDSLLKKKYKIRHKTLIIPMGVNMALLTEINQETKERIRTDYSLSKAFLGVYVGTLDKSRNIEFIINVIKDVQTNHSNLDFLIIGGEQNDIARLKQYAVNNNVDIVFTGNLDRKDLFNLLQMADFSISAIPPTKVFEISSPTKVFESMSLRCPVIANNEIKEQREIIEISEGGILVDYKQEEFVDAILSILQGNVDLKSMGEKGHAYVLEHRNYENMTLDIVHELEKYI